jgi:hypothetical protein
MVMAYPTLLSVFGVERFEEETDEQEYYE